MPELSTFSTSTNANFDTSKKFSSPPQSQLRKKFLIGGGIVIAGLIGMVVTLWLTQQPQDNRQQASELSNIYATTEVKTTALSKGININDAEATKIATEIQKINNSKEAIKLSSSGSLDSSTPSENLTWQAGVTAYALEKLRSPDYSPLSDFKIDNINFGNAVDSVKTATSLIESNTKKASSALGGISLGAQLTDSAVLPSSYDWRNVHGGNFLTGVKNQGSCGSCWAFSGNATTETDISAFYNLPDKKIDLSEQNLLSCSSNTTGCIGTKTLVGDYHNYVRDQGAVTESCMAYRSCDQTVASCACPAGAKCAGTPAIYKANYGLVPLVWTQLDNTAQILDTYATAQNIKKAIIEHGAVNTGIIVYSDFQYYVNGVYQRSSSSTYEGGHAISLIGWGEENGQAYWLFKNSWATSWGNQGYGKYKMFGSTPGSTMNIRTVYNSYRNVGGLDFGIEGLAGLFLIATDPSPLLVYADTPTAQNDTLARICTDRDNDGYCFWGLGSSKPASGCPASCIANSVPDCDDGKNTMGPNCSTISAVSPTPIPTAIPIPTATPIPSPTLRIPTSTPIPTATPIITGPPPIATITPSPTALVISGTPTVFLVADINQDKIVNQADLTILLANYGKTTFTTARADVNHDGKVNAIDYVFVLDFYGQTTH